MDFLGLGALLAALLIFGYGASRAWRARRLWVRLAGGIPATLLALVFGAALVLAFVGYGKLGAARPNPVPQLSAANTPAAIANGERFARTCAGCHSSNGQLPLGGHDFFGAEGGPPIGTFWAPNLTSAHLGSWSDGEIVRAIREGVGRDGRSLMIMPSGEFHSMSDEDVLSLVAYLRSQPAVQPNSPPKQINALGAIMAATVFPNEIFSAQPPRQQPVAAPPRGRTAEYGGYLASLGCRGCHGGDYHGIAPGGDGPPPGPDLVSFVHQHGVDAFIATLRTGKKPDGTPLSEEMPWKDLEKFSDDDFAAIALYLQSLK